MVLYADQAKRDVLEAFAPDLRLREVQSQEENKPRDDAQHPLYRKPINAQAVIRAEGEKCQRCWKYFAELSADPEHPGICRRCLEVVQGYQAVG